MLILIVIAKLLAVLMIGTVITGNLLGTYRQQVAKTFVFASWKGIQYFRKWVKGANPRTVLQIAQRNKFSLSLQIAQSCLTTLIQVYWKKQAVKMSAFNAWMKYNLLPQTGVWDFSKMVMSKGTLTPTVITTCTYDNGTGALLTKWSATLQGNQADSDKAVCVLVDTISNHVYVSPGTVIRTATQESFNVGAGLTAANLAGFLFFYRDLSTQYEKISNSDYSAVAEA